MKIEIVRKSLAPTGVSRVRGGIAHHNDNSMIRFNGDILQLVEFERTKADER